MHGCDDGTTPGIGISDAQGNRSLRDAAARGQGRPVMPAAERQRDRHEPNHIDFASVLFTNVSQRLGTHADRLAAKTVFLCIVGTPGARAQSFCFV
jgi:hypothetical protein